MLAYRLGRLDVAKILIDAGADQTTKDRKRNNLLHAGLTQTPEAGRLKPMLDLLDPGALIPMLKERNKFEDGGQSPLHEFCSSAPCSTHREAPKFIHMIKMLIEISPETATKAFKMLDGAGDTPLHTLLARDAHPSIIRTIIDFDASLLCCENAVGRTPAEVVHDRYLADHLQGSLHSRYHRRDESVSSLVHRQLYHFVEENQPDTPTEHESTTAAAQNWRLCAETMARNGQPKRTLVSLSSANFVSKRLGEQHTRDRYKFTFAEGKSGGSGEATPDAAAESQDSEVEETAKPVEKAPRLRRKDVVTAKYDSYNYAWYRE